MTPEDKLKKMGIQLPEPTKPLASYVPGVIEDDWLYISGQLPLKDGQLVYKGKLGADIDLKAGYEAAKLCAINGLAVLKSLAGDLSRVRKIVKLTGFVQSAPGFNEQPAVINGASELLGEIFGETGKHARSAVGVSELPLGAAVEIELIARIK